MNPWFETIAVILVALLAVSLGRLFSGLRKHFWLFGYVLPFLLIAMLAAARFSNVLAFIAPVCWFAAGRARFVVLSFAVPMGLITLLSRLPRRFEKVAVCILTVVVVSWFGVLPFLVPALIKGRLSNLTTRLDSNGICFQSTDYTCGPAAAVTALRRLGLQADEGELAILAHSTPVAGTVPDCLVKAINKRYEAEGLHCQYRRFDSLDQINSYRYPLVMLKDTFLSNHCVAILKISDKTVTFADPLWGKARMSREQFEKLWRFSGIVLKRQNPERI